MNAQVTQGIHRPTKCDGTCGYAGVAAEDDRPYQAESAVAGYIAIHGGSAGAHDLPSISFSSRGDRACQMQAASATVESGVCQQADAATNPTQDNGLVCRA